MSPFDDYDAVLIDLIAIFGKGREPRSPRRVEKMPHCKGFIYRAEKCRVCFYNRRFVFRCIQQFIGGR